MPGHAHHKPTCIADENDHILIKQIVGREVDSPSEPLIDNFFVVVIKLKIAKVGVNRWYERAFGMNDQADTTGKKITLFLPGMLSWVRAADHKPWIH